MSNRTDQAIRHDRISDCKRLLDEVELVVGDYRGALQEWDTLARWGCDTIICGKAEGEAECLKARMLEVFGRLTRY